MNYAYEGETAARFGVQIHPHVRQKSDGLMGVRNQRTDGLTDENSFLNRGEDACLRVR